MCRTTRSSPPTPAASPQLEAYMDALRKAGDSVGARIAVEARGVPVGLGEPLFDKLDADIAHAMMGINAVKGVEIGAGFAASRSAAAMHGDELTPQGFRGNHAGGVLGGISTGQDITVRIAIKPTSSIRTPRQSIDRAGAAGHGRDLRPPRPLRRHPRHADRRGDAGPGADGPRAAPPRAVRRRSARDPADRGPARRLTRRAAFAAAEPPGASAGRRATRFRRPAPRLEEDRRCSR